MGFILVSIVIFIIFALIIAAGKMVFNWVDSFMTYGNSIPFETFKKYYNENPDKWSLEHDHVTYTRQKGRYLYDITRDEFYFSFIDYIKYLSWKYRVEVEQAEKKNADILARIEKDYYGEEK